MSSRSGCVLAPACTQCCSECGGWQVESEKKFFRGQEISGKTLGVSSCCVPAIRDGERPCVARDSSPQVIGLGNIGAQVAETALHLGALHCL